MKPEQIREATGILNDIKNIDDALGTMLVEDCSIKLGVCIIRPPKEALKECVEKYKETLLLRLERLGVDL